MRSVRCRLGFHRWQRIKQPSDMEDEWLTRCRDCGSTSDGRRQLVVLALAVVASVTVFWFAPFLGALMMIGTVGSLLVVVTPVVVGRVVSWLSVGR
jgi:hypothetical protein